MKHYAKYIFMGLIMVVELYGLALLGYFYSISVNTVILIILIISVLLILITSAIIIKLLLEQKAREKRKGIQNWKKCPYFIDKYDYIENPEYIDKEIL